MEMDIFAEKVCAAVDKELGMGHKVEAREIRKNNGVRFHGLTILSEGRNVTPTIYLEGFLDAYESGMPFATVISELLALYWRNMPEGSIDMDFFLSYEKVKDRICYRLMGRKGNKGLLEEIPHIEFLDMAICFYYACQSKALGEGAILIHNAHMRIWDVCAEDLLRLAQANTPRLFPWQCSRIEDILDEMLEPDGKPSLLEGAWENPMRVLSNDRKMQGAACILYPNVLEEIAADMEGNLYILPSSVHETILLPDDGTCSAEELKKMVAEVNSTQVAPEDVLSDSLYYYDTVRKQIVMI